MSTSVTDQPKNSRGATKRESQPRDHRRAPVRVLVASSLPATATGLEVLLRTHADLELIVSWSREAQLEHVLRETDPDVLVLDVDEYDSANHQTLGFISRLAGVVPTIVLTASPSAAWMSRALQGRIRGLLPHGISGDELASALRAERSVARCASSPVTPSVRPSWSVERPNSAVAMSTPRRHVFFSISAFCCSKWLLA